MAELAQEIKALGDKITETLEAAQAAQSAAKAVEEVKGRVAEQDDTVKNAIEVSTKAMEQAQEIKQKIDAVEKTADFLEKTLARSGTGADDGERKEFEAKARDAAISYMRTGAAMPDDIVQGICSSISTKSLLGVSKEQRDLEVKQLVAGSDPDGGYFIRPERSMQMIQRIFETSPVRAVANIQTTNSDSLEFIIDDDEAQSGGWVGEVEQRGLTGTPKIGKLTIPVHEQFAQPRATQKMLDDAGFDVESWLSGKVTRKMSRVENTSFVVGDGSQKPRGFLSLKDWSEPCVYERHALEQVPTGVSADFTADGVKKLQNSLIEEYQANAVWGIKRKSWTNIITLKDGQGQYLLDPRSMKNGDTLTLLGKRVIFMNDMPDLADGSLSLVYGDFGVGYTIVDRFGFRVIRDVYTNKPYVLFYTTKRTGGDVTNFEAIKIARCSAS